MIAIRPLYCLTALAPVVLAATAPTVDLSYEVHQGTVNETGNYYLFSSIPYAQQPVGDLRFQKPVAVSGESSIVNNGSTTNKCIQGNPLWNLELQAYALGVSVDMVLDKLYNDEGQTESCLVLDVYAPTGIFDNATAVADAPVLVWIHGGGFTTGSKVGTGNPAGIIARSDLSEESAVIFVSINYRLGLFGWLAGNDDEITPNLGLYDQRMALEWIQQYISLFGGDSNRVTVMGESAGASSTLMHITAYGGADAPFQSAIPQSPAFQFNLNATYGYELTMEEASNKTGTTISSVDDLAALDTETLKSINQDVVYQGGAGMYMYGPIPDGTFVPKLPQVLLLEGKFDKSINVMASHNSNESVPFTPTNINTAAEVEDYLRISLPEASNDTIEYMLTEVWPDILDGTYPWETEFARTAKISTELMIACSTYFLAAAYENATHNYIFSYPPGYHAQDTSYTFFNGDTSTSDDGLPVNATIAQAMQDYIVAFAQTGDPNVSGLMEFPEYGDEAAVIEFTYGGVVQGVDDMANDRCVRIQQAMAQGLI